MPRPPTVRRSIRNAVAPTLKTLTLAALLGPASSALALQTVGLSELPTVIDGNAAVPIGQVITSCDLDGNGDDDLIVGAPDVSQVYIFLSDGEDDSWASVDSIDLTISGSLGTEFGASIACGTLGGELTLLIGAPQVNSGAGAAYLFKVSDLDNGRNDATVDDAAFDVAGSTSGAEFGHTVAFRGDTHLLVAAPATQSSTISGEVFAYSADLVINDSSNASPSSWYTPGIGSSFGLAITVGDLNGDDVDDIVIGEPGGSTNGVIHILEGKNIDSSGSIADLAVAYTSSLFDNTDFVNAEFGTSLDIVPALEIDGTLTEGENILVGSPGYLNGSGLVQILDASNILDPGDEKEVLVEAYSLGASGIIMRLGQSVAWLAEGSARTDTPIIAVGAPEGEPTSCSTCGIAYYAEVSGLSYEGGLQSTFSNDGVQINGETPTSQLGQSLTAISIDGKQGVAFGAAASGDGYAIGLMDEGYLLDGDGDSYSGASGDCDDSNADTYPLANELCDGEDNDCDGIIDNNLTLLVYPDGDDDGYGDSGNATTVDACVVPEGYSDVGEDCNDSNASSYPGAPEVCDFVDNDCDETADEGPITFYIDDDFDGYGVEGQTATYENCLPPEGYAELLGDCDDGNSAIYPEAPELCDGLDNDCNDSVDDVSDEDADEDGFFGCDDCDDSDATTYPGAEELCDELDNDCDDVIDESLYDDLDNDGFSLCTGDCDDGDLTIFPEASELCDAIDNDCDENIDEDFDNDEDGYFNGTDCADGDDCNDFDAEINPGSQEVCNPGDAQDDDCDGNIDEFVNDDLDDDGFNACGEGDCDDDEASVYPGAEELCDGLDNDCDDLSDEIIGDDADDDGASICDGDCDDGDAALNPDASEVCDELDNDCDSLVDEGISDDADGDGQSICEGDCDDSNATSYSGAEELCDDGVDNDCDDTVNELCSEPIDADDDGSTSDLDCNDEDDTVYPGADELCNTVDNDCDEIVDEGCVSEVDNDDDGFNSDVDCNDDDAAINPDAAELCNGVDDNCDGTVDEDCAATTDNDDDGFSDDVDCNDDDDSIFPGAEELCNSTDDDCDDSIDETLDDDIDEDGQSVCDGDCNDDDDSVYTGAEEACGNSIDNDCDDSVDEGCDPNADEDGDTYPASEDCDDNNPVVYPGAAERCDGLDNNCDGTVPSTEADDDGDGYRLCATDSLEVDCDDTNADVYPDAEEVCDALDTDCDGSIPSDERDRDSDGVLSCDDCDDRDAAAYPEAEEICDGADNNCDGTIDEGFDEDGDGYTDMEACGDAGDDCDDDDDEISPAASEVKGNNVDEDCNGIAADMDGDGYCEDPSDAPSCQASPDCDDLDAEINPEAEDIFGDDIDQDCDGADNTPTPVPPTPTPEPETPTEVPPIEVGDPGLTGSDSGDGVSGVAFSCNQSTPASPGSALLMLMLGFAAHAGSRRRQ